MLSLDSALIVILLLVVFYFRFLIEEVRKTLVALWQGTKGAISPESLFCVIWKVVPRFRYGSQ